MNLDMEHIDQATTWLASELIESGCASAIITPNDGTQYGIVITGQSRRWSRNGFRKDGHLWVTLKLGSMGQTYEWAGWTVHADYAAEKWTTESHQHTGKVMAEILNSLSSKLPKDFFGVLM